MLNVVQPRLFLLAPKILCTKLTVCIVHFKDLWNVAGSFDFVHLVQLKQCNSA